MSRIETRQAVQNNKDEVRNLNKKHELQLEKMRLAQAKRVNDLQHQNTVELHNKRTLNDQRILEETEKNEQKLNALQHSLDKSREAADAELSNIRTNLNQQKENQKALQELDYTSKIQDHEIKLADLDHEFKTQTDKMQRQARYEKTAQQGDNAYELDKQKEEHVTQKETQKDSFMRTHQSNQDKFQMALQKQRLQNAKRIAHEETNAQRRIQNKENHYNLQMQKLQTDRDKKLEQKNSEFEKNFQSIDNTNRNVLQNIISKREKLINHLQKDLWHNFQIGVEKSQDPFYDFGNIPSHVTENSDGKGYTIEVPLAEHAMENIKMTAEKRTLKLLFDRRHEFTKNDEGRSDTVKKVESFVSRIDVVDIIDPNSIKKSFKDGKVIFTIAKA